MFKYYQYETGDIRIVSTLGSYLLSNNIEKNKTGITDIEEVKRISLSRSRRRIREIVLCNDFKYFVTLTVKDTACDRFDIDACEDLLRKYLKHYKRYHKDFIYVLIAESHDKGGYHFHGFFGGVCPRDLKLFKEEDFKRLPYYILDKIRAGEEVFYFPLFQDNMGWTTLTKINHLTKSLNYSMKYISYNCIRNSAGTIYISSRGLRTPDSYLIKEFDFETFLKFANKNGIFYNFDTNDYCKTLDFNLNDLPIDLKLNFENFIKDFNSPIPDFLSKLI